MIFAENPIFCKCGRKVSMAENGKSENKAKLGKFIADGAYPTMIEKIEKDDITN